MIVTYNEKDNVLSAEKDDKNLLIVTKENGEIVETPLTVQTEMYIKNINTDALSKLPDEDYSGIDKFFNYRKGLKTLNKLLSKPVNKEEKDKYLKIRELIKERCSKLLYPDNERNSEAENDKIRVKLGNYILELKIENSEGNTYNAVDVVNTETSEELEINKIISCMAKCISE